MVERPTHFFVVLALLAWGTTAAAQVIINSGADTAESAALKGMGAYLRGAGSYNLNTAQAESINTDTLIRWKQDLRRIATEDRAEMERKQTGKRQHIDEVKRRLAVIEYELRVNPTATDVQNGQALNALLFDLMDPDIASKDWYEKKVLLPKGMSVKDLLFRFMPTRGSTSASKVLSRGVIALSRLDVQGENWPTVMKNTALDKERAAYESAYSKLRDELLNDKFNVKTLLALDKSLDALKAKVQTAVPKERGFRDEAVKFVEELKDATRMFDAATVDYAREILVDTKDQNAITVAELVSFMLKYRLQFASAERSATGRVLYGQIYEVMRQQTDEFGIKPPVPPEAPVAQVDKSPPSPFQPKSVWESDRQILTVIERNGETFQVTLNGRDGKYQRLLKGTIKDKQISWLAKDTRDIQGGPVDRDYTGTIMTDKDGDRIDFVWRDSNGRSGSVAFYRRKDK